MDQYYIYKMQERVIKELNDKYPEYTITTELNPTILQLNVNIWNCSYWDRNLLLRVPFDSFEIETETFDYVIEKVSKALEKKIYPEIGMPERINIKRCECCGAPLTSLTCDYCGVKYYGIE